MCYLLRRFFNRFESWALNQNLQSQGQRSRQLSPPCPSKARRKWTFPNCGFVSKRDGIWRNLFLLRQIAALRVSIYRQAEWHDSLHCSMCPNRSQYDMQLTPIYRIYIHDIWDLHSTSFPRMSFEMAGAGSAEGPTSFGYRSQPHRDNLSPELYRLFGSEIC